MSTYTTRKFLALLVLSLLVGVGLVTIIATSKPGQSYLFPTISKPDYRVVCCWPTNDGTVSVSAGASYSTWVTVDSVNSFIGSVALSVDLDLPAAISPTVLNLTPRGEVQAAKLTISVPANTLLSVYTGTVAATSDSLVRAATFEVSVGSPEPDFSITADPASLTVSPSTTGTARVAVASLNGFEGTVNLSTTGVPAGFAVSLEGFNVTLTAGESAQSFLIVYMLTDSLATDFELVVTGTSDSRSHRVAVSVDSTVSSIPDFLMIAVPLFLDVTAGNSVSSTIQLGSVNGFAGDVSLTAGILPPIPDGPQISLSEAVVSLTPGGSATSILTVSTTSNTPQQYYNFSITGAGGSVTHEVWGSIAVGSPTEGTSLTMRADPSSSTPPCGQSELAMVTVMSVHGFSGDAMFIPGAETQGHTWYIARRGQES